ncbi:MAG: nucleotide exchange factor GrpE [Muribaculaceae bacterium]|nr:nucleotide exchange factor GrpE [Muribaculaceae bacterium]
MNKENIQDKDRENPEYNPEDVEQTDNFDAQEGNDQEADISAESEAMPEDKIASLEEELAKEKKEYMFLMAEFDNFRKRTLREKSEIIRNAGESVLKGLLPIVDDFERGLKAGADAADAADVVEGMTLIYNKLKKYLEQNGVKEIDPEEKDFDTEKHEAISVVPAPDESLKGKILDTVEKGYMINDKVLRHAKVVVGQ